MQIKDIHKPTFETALVMQGGGSLGAYECGVYKTLDKRGIKFDIVSGTSIGAINAGIIAGSKTGRPTKDLEEFWLRISETVTPPLSDTYRSMAAATLSAMWGNVNMFQPLWNPMVPLATMPYLYDLAPLKKTLSKYIDFSKLVPGNQPRLIVTSTDIKTSQPVVFDSHKHQITTDHLIGCAGFPSTGSPGQRWMGDTCGTGA